MIDTAIILAAGFGTRLRPITEHMPKALVQINGQAIVDRIIMQLRMIGIKRIYINAHYLSEQIVEHFIDAQNIVVIVEPELLGSGGSVRHMMNIASLDRALVVNCDEYFISHHPLLELIENFKAQYMQQLLLLNHVDNSNERPIGDFALDQEMRIIRHAREDHRIYKFVGAYIIDKTAFKHNMQAKFPMTDLWFQTKDISLPYYGHVTWQEVIDIGTHSGFNKAGQQTPKQVFEQPG